jgi:hypothetical protein
MRVALRALMYLILDCTPRRGAWSAWPDPAWEPDFPHVRSHAAKRALLRGDANLMRVAGARFGRELQCVAVPRGGVRARAVDATP